MAEISSGWKDGDRSGQCADLIEAILARRQHRLRFPAALESRFECRTGPDRCRGFVRYGLMGFVLCNMFIFNYFSLLPDIAWRELVAQCAIMTPVALAVALYMRSEPPVFRRELTQVCAALLGLVVPVIAYQGSVYPNAIFFRYAPILTLLYINVVAAVRFRFALPASAAVVLCNIVDLWLLKDVGPDVKSLVAGSIITTCGFTLLANHRLEREQRRTYLLNEREALQRDEIIRLAGERARVAALYAQEREQAAIDSAAHAAELRDAHRIARIGTWTHDLAGPHVAMSSELHKLFGTDPQTFEPTRENLIGLIHPKDRAAVDDAVARAVTGEVAVEQEWRLLRSDGSIAWFWSEMHLEQDPTGRGPALRGVCKDVTEHRVTAERIYRLAHHDPLTGLANRALLRERTVEAIDRNRRTSDRLAVLCFDLDGFKAVNDVHGHGTGDRLLCEVAARLKRAVQETSTVARLGGDEFVVLLTDSVQPAGAGEIAEQLIAALRAPYDLGFGEMHGVVTASVGVARFPADGRDPETLLHNADTALYQAKWAGKNQVVFFRSEMDDELRERRVLERDLHQAALRGEMTLVWQPLSAAADDGEITGFEVLLRWRHPDRGMMAPDLFIPIAEACGAISSIGAWVLQQACWEATRWTVPLRVAVNVSPVQVQQGEAFVEMVERVLVETGLAPERLVLEVTEGVLIRDATRVLAALNRLKALGIQMALDDFGTGYSSLATLRAFPFDQIKIDRSFVAAIGSTADGGDMAIVQAVLGLARGLGVPVVAEGVETEMQLGALRRAGCEEVQGWLIGRPAPIETFSGLIGGANGCRIPSDTPQSPRPRDDPARPGISSGRPWQTANVA